MDIKKIYIFSKTSIYFFLYTLSDKVRFKIILSAGIVVARYLWILISVSFPPSIIPHFRSTIKNIRALTTDVLFEYLLDPKSASEIFTGILVSPSFRVDHPSNKES
jgi:hypothetical protein